MKMENTVEAADSGVVEAVFVNEGENVKKGFVLLKLTTDGLGHQ